MRGEGREGKAAGRHRVMEWAGKVKNRHVRRPSLKVKRTDTKYIREQSRMQDDIMVAVYKVGQLAASLTYAASALPSPKKNDLVDRFHVLRFFYPLRQTEI